MKKSRPPQNLGVSASLRDPKNEDGKPALVPKLRFPEFRHAARWIESRLQEAAQINPANGGLPESFIYIDLESVEAGELKAKARISRDGAPSRAQRLVECGDIIYQVVRPYQRNNLLCEFEDEHDYVASTGYAQLRAKGSNRFLYQSIHTDSFVARVMAKCTGSNYPAINSSDLAEIELPLPPTLEEQQKIAECLSSVDELMAAQGRKVDALKTHKKGLMQQLFPREGETQPRLRFPEFQNAGEWEVRWLEELVDIQSGATPSKTNPAFWNGSVPWVSAKDMKRLFLDDAEDHISDAAIDDGARLVPAGTLLMLTRGMTLLKDVPICILRREMSFNQDVKGLRPKDGTDGLFLAWMLTGHKDRLLAMVDIAGHGTGKLDTDELKALALMVPSPVEQHRIASCLSSLDALITAETQKLAALKTHKKGLMQQLFPSPEEQTP